MTIRASLLGFCGVFVLGLVLTGCRQDMHNQPKFIPLRSSEFFADRRSARYPVAGTIPQLCPHFAPASSEAKGENPALCTDAASDSEQLDPNSYFLTGRHNNGPLGNDLPAEVMPSASDPESTQKNLYTLLKRGQERYNIYCTPCHSLLGDGNGMIVQRGYKRPPSFHQDRLRQAPLGHFFDVATNGFGAMPDYAAQIQPEDRWAIAAYIRALQLSQNALQNDVAQEDLPKLNAPPKEYKNPPTSVPNRVTPEAPAGGVKP